MGSGIIRPVSEELYIYMGLTKEKWTGFTPQRVRDMLDNPEETMDDHVAHEELHKCFYKYHDEYWDKQRLKK